MAFDLSNKELLFSSGLAEKMLGYSLEELEEFARRDFVDIVHPDDLALKDDILKRLEESEDGEVVTSIFRVKGANGKYRHLQIYDSVYERDENGVPTKISTVAEDITSEAEMSARLKEAVEVIGKIKYKNSHDLRGPVSTIMGIMSLLDSSHFHNKYQCELLEHLGATVKKLDDIIHEINDHEVAG